MIQRKQTLWLLLSVISNALTFKFPFYSGIVLPGTKGVTGAELTATDNIFLIILSVAVLALALVAIFLYNDRKKQVLLAVSGLVCSVGLIAVYFVFTRNFQTGNIALTAILTLFMLIGFFFAIRGIQKDQKLIRDLNRLR